MSMYVLDMDEATLDTVLRDLRDGLGGSFYEELARTLERQRPIPVPTKIGAVVQTDSKLCAPDLSIFIRWASDEQTPNPWILREELDRIPYRTKDIGRITRVLSEGVDL